MRDRHEHVIQYLQFLKYTLNWQVTIKQQVGFLKQLGEEMYLALYPFLNHLNSYCMEVKSHPKLFSRCLSMHEKLIAKCDCTTGISYGICHAGVGEFLIPVRHEADGLIAYLNVGCFSNLNPIHAYAHQRFLRQVTEGRVELVKRYNDLPDRIMFGKEEVAQAAGIIIHFLLNCYDHVKETNALLEAPTVSEQENAALSRIIPFIRQNYKQKISVGNLVEISHFSESYINHTFKKHMGVNVRTYINWLRIEEAKKMLKRPQWKIIDIAMELGFSSSEYFCKVFSRNMGISPSEFRLTHTDK